MSNRITTPVPAERTQFGLLAWLEKTKITLPLKGVECTFAICGDVASVELDQIFQQNSSRPLDCLYTFPLPASAAVYRCEMHVDGRVIAARVEERERAKELAREKKQAGHRTALVEMERDNLFTLSLGNVQPGDVIVVRFAYFQTLSRLGEWTSLSIPFCPGVRYIPGVPLLRGPKGRGVVDDTDQVPDASRISPPRIDRLHADAAYLWVEGTLEHPLEDVKDVSSPSHPVFVRSRQGCSSITIAERAAVPDCDFILRWTELQPEAVKPVAWVSRDQNETYALVRLRAPEQVEASDKYPQDFYFLIDRSGSMEGLKWQKAVEAFRAFLKVLGNQDRAWATFFESRVRDFAEQPLPPAKLLSDSGVGKLESLGATGGTELLPAIEHVLGKIQEHSKERPSSLILITDGQVGNEGQILQSLAKHSRLRVHIFGIDVAINDGFLNKLAAQHHGASSLLSPQDDIVGAVTRLGTRLRRPLLTSIRVAEGWELAGPELADLHAGEAMSLPLKARTPDQPLIMEGKLIDGTTQRYSFDLLETSTAALRLLWAKRRIDSLLAAGNPKAAISLAKENNLVCEGAAFIAWDEAEKVPVSGPDSEVYQPSMALRFLAESPLGCEKADALYASLGDMPLKRAAGSAFFVGDGIKSSGLRWLRRFAGAPTDVHDSHQLVARWRADIAQDALFQTSPGLELLDCLAGFAQSQVVQDETWLIKLYELLNSLKGAAQQPVAARLELLRKWVEQHLADPGKAQALKTIARMETLAPSA